MVHIYIDQESPGMLHFWFHNAERDPADPEGQSMMGHFSTYGAESFLADLVTGAVVVHGVGT